MKKLLIASSLSMMMVSAGSYADLPTPHHFNYKTAKNYTVSVETAAELADNLQSETTTIDTKTDSEFTIASGTLTSTVGVVYVSAPASAIGKFYPSSKSWIIDETKDSIDSGLTLRFDGVDAAVDGREINKGLPAYPVTKSFRLIGKKGANLSAGAHNITFDYAVWVG